MKERVSSQFPNLDEEDKLRAQGYELIAGIDEVGRGALAGPVVAGAVILPHSTNLSWFELVRDSKELTSRKRESLFDLINKEAVAVGIGIIPPRVIDSVNILGATRLAMIQAVEKLLKQPTFLLIDRLTLPQCPIPQRGITRGDRLCLSIACASVIAKVTRDRIMEEFDQIHPGYEFALHKGYGTGRHISCLQKLGPSPVHRLYFAPVRNMIASRGVSPLASGHTEPFAQCNSEPSTACHPAGAERTNNLIQGKLQELPGNEPTH